MHLTGNHHTQVAGAIEDGPPVVEAVVGSTVPSAPVPFSAVPIVQLWLPSPGLGLRIDFDTGSCKTLATIAGQHLQMAADVRLPTSSKLDG